MSFLEDIEDAAKSCEFVADSAPKSRLHEERLAARLRDGGQAWSHALGIAKLALTMMLDHEDHIVRKLAQGTLDEIKRLVRP